MARRWNARRECALLAQVLVIGAVAAVALLPILPVFVILTGPQGLARAWCVVVGFGGSLFAASAAGEWLPSGAVPIVR